MPPTVSHVTLRVTLSPRTRRRRLFMPGLKRTGALLAISAMAVCLLSACGGSRASIPRAPSRSTTSPHLAVNAVSAFESYWTAVDEAAQAAINPNATDASSAVAYATYLAGLRGYRWPAESVPAIRALEKDVSTLISDFQRTGGDDQSSAQLLTAEANEANAEGRVEYTLGIHSDRSQTFFDATSTVAKPSTP
jgi:hypothetical protein